VPTPPPTAELRVVSDFACDLQVDGRPAASLKANDNAPHDIRVSFGAHNLVAISKDGKLRWTKMWDAKPGPPQPVEISLKEAKRVYFPEDFDRQLSRVWMGVSDINLAAEYAASILDKSWGFQDKTLSTALRTAHEYLKEPVEDLRLMEPTDASGRRIAEEVTKLGATVDKYTDFVTKAIAEGQKANSWLGAPQDLYAEARALAPKMVFPAEALNRLRNSKVVSDTVPVDRRSDLGLAADPRDFDLGAKYYLSTPNMFAVVSKGGMASEMGFRAGDRLASVAGQNVNSLWDLKLAVRANLGKKIRVAFEREGKREDREIKCPVQLR
jgi:hypothetical protein